MCLVNTSQYEFHFSIQYLEGVIDLLYLKLTNCLGNAMTAVPVQVIASSLYTPFQPSS